MDRYHLPQHCLKGVIESVQQRSEQRSQQNVHATRVKINHKKKVKVIRRIYSRL